MKKLQEGLIYLKELILFSCCQWRRHIISASSKFLIEHINTHSIVTDESEFIDKFLSTFFLFNLFCICFFYFLLWIFFC